MDARGCYGSLLVELACLRLAVFRQTVLVVAVGTFVLEG